MLAIPSAAFAGIAPARILSEPEGCSSNYWLQTLLLDDSIATLRDELLQATNDGGLMTRPIWELMSKLPPYRDCPRMPLPIAESLERRVINLPSSASLAGC